MALQTLLYLAITTFLAFIIIKFIIKPYISLLHFKKSGFHVRFLPFVGYPYEFITGYSKYGDPFHTMKVALNGPKKYKGLASNIASKPALYIVDTGLIKEFSNHPEYYEKPEFFFGYFRDGMEGLAMAEGAKWKKHRKLVSMVFHYELLKESIPDIALITKEFFNKLKKTPMKNVSIMDEYQAITGEAIGRLFFGEKFSQYTIEGVSMTSYMAETIAALGRVTLDPVHLLLGKDFVKKGYFKLHRDTNHKKEMIFKICSQIISNKMKEIEETQGQNMKRKNLVQLFYEQRKAQPQDALSDDDILAEFITFFVGGMDTTGHLLTAATYHLIKNPQFKKRLMEEVDKYCPTADNVNLDELSKMEFMTAFMKETLRLSTPAPFVFEREAVVDHCLEDVFIKKGTLIKSVYITNNVSARYHEDPESFNPNRWLDSDSLTSRSVNSDPFLFTPFASGPRNCIGQHMAMNEARLIFSLFLKNFDYELSNKKFDGKYNFRFLLEFAEDLKLDLKGI